MDVLPVVYTARRAPTCGAGASDVLPAVPPAFLAVEVQFDLALPVIKEWLLEHAERMCRVGGMNAKAGALETADVRRSGNARFTMWFEPTRATFSVLTPNLESQMEAGPADERDADSIRVKFDGFHTTPQTLMLVAELDATPKSG